MGGKGKRRREKNYRAAHGGYTGLPPPPKPSQLDALPSKLRQIISFTQQSNGATRSSKNEKNDDGHPQNRTPLKNKGDVGIVDVIPGDTDGQLQEPEHVDWSEEQLIKSGASAIDKKKKKRKRKEVKDLRFAMEVDKTSTQLKRRERRKKYLESKKKQHKKTHEEEKLDFPGQEKIKFGDIVQAPPKLVVPAKAFKNASQERLRLQAIEEYRSRKGWKSRPGSHLPPPATMLDS